MATSKQLRILATNPHAHARWLTTGRLPEGKKPKGPLVDLLAAISPRDRTVIMGVKVSDKLGYSGYRMFHTAAQAFRWIHPEDEVFGSFPADSWRLKQFHHKLYLEDLLEQCVSWPDSLLERYPRLRRPQPRQKALPNDQSTDNPSTEQMAQNAAAESATRLDQSAIVAEPGTEPATDTPGATSGTAPTRIRP